MLLLTRSLFMLTNALCSSDDVLLDHFEGFRGFNMIMYFRRGYNIPFNWLVVTVVYLCFGAALVCSAEPNIDISLGNVTHLNGEEPVDKVIPTFQNDLTVTLNDFPADSAFVLFQVYSFPHPVTVKPLVNRSTNLGQEYSFIVYPSKEPAVFVISSPPTLPTRAMVIATAYSGQYPVPGGCAMESVAKNSPSLAIETMKSTVKLNGQKAALSIHDTTLCQGSGLSYEFFYKFAFDVETSDEYFEQIKTMLTYPRMTENANEVSYLGGPPTQRIFALYSGVRVYYGLAIKSLEKISVYPPISLLMEDEMMYETLGMKFVLGCVLYMGLVLCLSGHAYFPISLFFSGLLAGQHASYAGCVLGGVQEDDIWSWALLGGLIVGCTVVLIWLFLAMPVFCIIFPIISSSYLAACFIFYVTTGNVALFGGPSYWGILIALVVFVSSICLVNPVYGTMTAFAFLGSYLIIHVFNYIFGGHLQYITINPLRRLTETGFDEAITTPPLQTVDIFLMCAWMSISTLGFLKQRRHARGRAPFPPPPRLSRLDPMVPSSDERRPLLPNEDRPPQSRINVIIPRS